ncbi:CoxG family protein [Amycolatopsis echigonensis]|uniref:SRPBCC family protein n=1 Tax=Amycolatopsis echigonensis TaxID=2576905 RepID=A0A8E1W5B8_9PSEU|nr:SRPBCC domain-containing protein [Amycolatopsis echigonensis]MBB2503998.1 SRPBCC family protein [Amycolatopsis echigonensis]
MKLREEFQVGRPVAEVWTFFDEPARVAGCVPGVEDLTMRGPDDIDVRVTQSVGPMTATFAASITIVERVPEKLIAFTATGKTVRGAMGNVRATVNVQLEPAGERTTVIVEGDVALAGALGSVGQKVVAKQARKVTGAFSRNLETALGGETAAAPVTTPAKSIVDAPAPVAAADPWAKVAAALSAVSVAVSLATLARSFQRARR